MSWCKGCGAKVEWHPRVDGRQVAINPDPDPAGTLAFGPGMKLALALPRSKPRMYRYHLSTCPKPDEAIRRSASMCDHDGCELTTKHYHCFKCGETDHFASACEAAV